MAEHKVNESLADVLPKTHSRPGSPCRGIAPKGVTDPALSQGSEGQKVPHPKGMHGTTYNLGELLRIYRAK